MKTQSKYILMAAAISPLLLAACAVEPTGYYGSEYPDGDGASISYQQPATVVTEPDGSVYYTPGATYYDGYWHGGHYGRQ